MFGRPNKYHNTKCEWMGIKFDSKKELLRYQFLLSQEEAGLIRNIQRQVTFELVPTQYEDVVKHLKTRNKIVRQVLHRPITYTCDFTYEIVATGEYVVEDVKASKSFAALDKAFLLKEKLMFYFKRIKIKRVYKPTDQI